MHFFIKFFIYTFLQIQEVFYKLALNKCDLFNIVIKFLLFRIHKF
jgi:hypothetical protein